MTDSRKELTPAEYKFAAEQLAACLLNGIGVYHRFAELMLSSKPRSTYYELSGWLQDASELAGRYYESRKSTSVDTASDYSTYSKGQLT